jgi:hypothetical protein
VTDLTIAQRNFLRLHVKHAVDKWQWHFCETQLRAHAGRRKATIWRDELDDLVSRGLVNVSHGNSVYATMTGRDLVS